MRIRRQQPEVVEVPAPILPGDALREIVDTHRHQTLWAVETIHHVMDELRGIVPDHIRFFTQTIASDTVSENGRIYIQAGPVEDDGRSSTSICRIEPTGESVVVSVRDHDEAICTGPEELRQAIGSALRWATVRLLAIINVSSFQHSPMAGPDGGPILGGDDEAPKPSGDEDGPTSVEW